MIISSFAGYSAFAALEINPMNWSSDHSLHGYRSRPR